MYSLITAIVSIFLVPIFLLHPRGRLRLSERFGFRPLPSGDYLWIHAASFGEMRGIVPLITKLRELHSGIQILITATSPTAFATIESAVDHCRLLPFDSQIWLNRAFGHIKIRRMIVTEKELWPGLLRYLRSKNIRLDIVNARISDSSWPRYYAFRSFVTPILEGVNSIATIDKTSAERFTQLGVDPGRISVCGNSKYDFHPGVTDSDLERTRFIRGDLPVLTLASLRPGEEHVWFSAVKDAVVTGKIQLIVAPRHQEKFRFFEEQLSKYGIEFVKRSSAILADPGRALLLDSLGELEKIYSFSDLAFIGGTLENFGGHNMMEAAAYGVALALGPHRGNIREVAAELELRNGILSIEDSKDAAHLVNGLINKDPSIKQKGAIAREFWKQNLGATERIVELLARSEQ